MRDLKNLLSKVDNKTLMLVFPHPDDEAILTSGLLVIAKKMGWITVVVTLTKGGAGKIHMNPKGKSAVELRGLELQKSESILGVDHPVIGMFDDAKLRNQVKKWKPWLKKTIGYYNPGIVVTYDHSGVSGHPDHVCLSVVLKKMLVDGKKPPILLWASVPDSLKKKFVHPRVSKFSPSPTYKLFIGFNILKKYQALRAHRSQALLSSFRVIVLLLFGTYEWYHEVDLKKDYKHRFIEYKI